MPTTTNAYSNIPPPQYDGSFLDPSQAPTGNLYGQSDFGQKSYTGNDFDDEPPLLEGNESSNWTSIFIYSNHSNHIIYLSQSICAR